MAKWNNQNVILIGSVMTPLKIRVHETFNFIALHGKRDFAHVIDNSEIGLYWIIWVGAV